MTQPETVCAMNNILKIYLPSIFSKETASCPRFLADLLVCSISPVRRVVDLPLCALIKEPYPGRTFWSFINR